MKEQNKDFLKIQDDEADRSRRSSSIQEQRYFEQIEKGLGFQNINVVFFHFHFGRCIDHEIKAERDEESIKICGISFALNCNLIAMTFGVFFLVAGSILTTLCYKTQSNLVTTSNENPSPEGHSRNEGKIAGPLFLIIGSFLLTVGILLSYVNYRINQNARQFSLPIRRSFNSDQDATSFFSLNLNRGSELDESLNSSKRNSTTLEHTFLSENNIDRRRTLPTIAQTVCPAGFFLDGKFAVLNPDSGEHRGRSHSTESERLERDYPSTTANTTVNSSFSIEGSPSKKPNLALRPSLPIPILSPYLMSRPSRTIAPFETSALFKRSRSDEPFGSIASLTNINSSIACFPNTTTSNSAAAPNRPIHLSENLNTNNNGNPSDRDGKGCGGGGDLNTSSKERKSISWELPAIRIQEEPAINILANFEEKEKSEILQT